MPVDSPDKQTEPLLEFVDRVRRELAANGHRFRSREEIDNEIAQLRDEWDNEEE